MKPQTQYQLKLLENSFLNSVFPYHFESTKNLINRFFYLVTSEVKMLAPKPIKILITSYFQELSLTPHFWNCLFQTQQLFDCLGKYQFTYDILNDILHDTRYSDDMIDLVGCLLGWFGIPVLQVLFEQFIPENIHTLTDYMHGHILAHITFVACLFAGVPSFLQNQSTKFDLLSCYHFFSHF